MPSRGSEVPKYVYVQRIKGKTYYRFRRNGLAVRLPDFADKAAFHAAYARLMVEPEAPLDRYTEGSVAHTIDLYLRSADFSKLKLGTKRDYRRYLDRLDRAAGAMPMARLDNSFWHQIRDKLKDTPSAATHAISVGRTLCRFAVSRRIITSDPTAGIGRLGGGESYERWQEAALNAFRASASPTMRLALELGVYTGQRLSDVIAMRWESYNGDRIMVRQQKTGVNLSIPAHPDLRALLDPLRKDSGPILTSRSGLPFHPRVFSRDFRNARIAAGLPDGLSFHGLRHTAASVLAEAGATGPEIQSITGHKSLKLVEHYIRQADQEVQAKRAIARLPESGKTAKLDR